MSNSVSQKGFLWTIRTILVFGKTCILICTLQSSFIFRKKLIFVFIMTILLFSRGKFWKAPLCLWSSRRGLYFWKTNISGILGHAHFGKVLIFFIFGTCGYYIFGTYLVCGGYVHGTWMVHGWYVVGMWIQSQNWTMKGPMRIIPTMLTC